MTHNVRMRLVLALIALSVALGACAKPKAAVVGEPAVLQVPPPPPRVVVPPDEPEPDLGTDDADKNEPKARPRPALPKAAPPPKPGDAAPPATVEPAKPNPVPPPDAARLQPVLPTSTKEVEHAVIERLDRAKSNLDKVDYQTLSADAKVQYDMAKRFMDQARQAITDKNLVYAGKLAEKAGNIAAVLVGR
jgi:hypothetical protein